MNFIAAGLSDVGLHREHNEDSFCILSEHRLFIVADGMGGHRGGDVASRMATHSISSFFDDSMSADATDEQWPFSFDPTLSVDENRLVNGIKIANFNIYDASGKHREVQGMGTTCVSGLFSKELGRMYFANVGDSRAYRVRGQSIGQLTRDHSLINDYLLVMPNLSESQRRELPSNVITRALGMQDSVAVDLYVEDVEPGDVFVLCSDGLNGMLADDEILEAVDLAEGVEAATKALIDGANDRGGEDNITVVIVKITE